MAEPSHLKAGYHEETEDSTDDEEVVESKDKEEVEKEGMHMKAGKHMKARYKKSIKNA